MFYNINEENTLSRFFAKYCEFLFVFIFIFAGEPLARVPGRHHHGHSPQLQRDGEQPVRASRLGAGGPTHAHSGHRETERQRNRETEIKKDRETGIQRDVGTKRQKDKETKRHRNKETKSQKDRET